MSRRNWLEQQLDREDLTDAEFSAINKEYNELMDKIEQPEKERKAALEAKRLADLARIQELMDEENVNQLVLEYGEQFRGDYTITDNFDVLSFAFNERNPDQQKVWQCGTHEAAIKRVNTLLYYRVYDHYVRNRNDE